ncbi:hypothetical protein E2C01_045901 [Portunus trituberculatus]|uniref:Uncharacterized protein n=1 Tax=Portunus trituberculatus TaxID=210409 RepID=A0A5B7FX04_PORTR|nr:hypothetical protein [Portunus trituberculatus]
MSVRVSLHPPSPSALQHAILYTQLLPLLHQGLGNRTLWLQFLPTQLLALLHPPQHRGNVRVSMLGVFPLLAGLTWSAFHPVSADN